MSNNGADVIACGRNKAKLDKAKSSHPKLRIEVCDVADDSQVAQLAKMIAPEGGVDILINNAWVFENINHWVQSLPYQLSGTSVKVFELMPPLVDSEMLSQFEGQKMIPHKELAKAFVKGFNLIIMKNSSMFLS